MARFFTSDSHFSDSRFDLFYRPFKTVKEQDEHLIKMWNSVVGEKDEVFHLGDFSTTDKGVEIAKRLNGKIHLIIGNYDDPRPVAFLKKNFESISIFKDIKIGGKKVHMQHYPDKAKTDCFNLVAHVHSLWKVQRNMINVSTDAWNYTPISEKQIEFCMNAIENHYDVNVFAGELEANKVENSELTVIHTGEEHKYIYNKTVFLSGPSPRDKKTKSWRGDMVSSLEKAGFTGIVLDPETKGEFQEKYDYDNQVDWEDKGLNMADVIIFWVPRDLKDMPGFTTNVEYGYWLNSGKCVLGYPNSAEKMNYLKYKADKFNIPVSHSMKGLAEIVVNKLGK